MTEIKIVEAKTEDERRIVAEHSLYSFYASPSSLDELLKLQKLQQDVYELIVYEDEVPVSSAQSFPLTQNIRGKLFNMAGVAMVASYPEARRRGYIRKLMHTLFNHMKSNQQVFSTLQPFKERFYEKLGYAPFQHYRSASFSPEPLVPFLNQEIDGHLTRMSMEDGFISYKKYLRKFQSITHGCGLFTDIGSVHLGKRPFWIVFAHSGNEIVGLMTYRITGYVGKLVILEFLYTNSTGKYLLLQWLAQHTDQVKEITLPLLPDDLSENWAFDLNAKIQTGASLPDRAMGRIIDVSGLSGMNVGSGDLSLEIIDTNCSWNNAEWNFSSNNGILGIDKTTRSDGKLTIQGLSALVYGVANPADFQFLGWGNPNRDVQRRMLELFPRQLPFLHSRY
ncbi:MAG: GNAT family N-acetyltransferase [Candidatus Kariarchaeaceae archaeon]